MLAVASQNANESQFLVKELNGMLRLVYIREMGREGAVDGTLMRVCT